MSQEPCVCATMEWSAEDMYSGLEHHPNCPVMNPKERLTDNEPTEPDYITYPVSVPSYGLMQSSMCDGMALDRGDPAPVIVGEAEKVFDDLWGQCEEAVDRKPQKGFVVKRKDGTIEQYGTRAGVNPLISDPTRESYEEYREKIVPPHLLDQQRAFERQRGDRWKDKDCDCGICPSCNAISDEPFTVEVLNNKAIGGKVPPRHLPMRVFTESCRATFTAEPVFSRAKFDDSDYIVYPRTRPAERRPITSAEWNVLNDNKCSYSEYLEKNRPLYGKTDEDDLGLKIGLANDRVYWMEGLKPETVRGFLSIPEVWEVFRSVLAADDEKISELKVLTATYKAAEVEAGLKSKIETLIKGDGREAGMAAYLRKGQERFNDYLRNKARSGIQYKDDDGRLIGVALGVDMAKPHEDQTAYVLMHDGSSFEMELKGNPKMETEANMKNNPLSKLLSNAYICELDPSSQEPIVRSPKDQQPKQPILVIAGSYDEFESFCKSKGVAPKPSDYEYISRPLQLKLYKTPVIIRTGTWYKRDDYYALVEEIDKVRPSEIRDETF